MITNYIEIVECMYKWKQVSEHFFVCKTLKLKTVYNENCNVKWISSKIKEQRGKYSSIHTFKSNKEMAAAAGENKIDPMQKWRRF